MDPEYQEIIHPVNIKIEEGEVPGGEIDLVELQYFIISINQIAIDTQQDKYNHLSRTADWDIIEEERDLLIELQGRLRNSEEVLADLLVQGYSHPPDIQFDGCNPQEALVEEQERIEEEEGSINFIDFN